MKNKTHPVIKIFLGVFGLVAIVWSIGALQTDTSSWPSVQAKIVSSSTTSNELSHDETYEYQVNNVRHSGSFYNDADWHRPGDEITVYYDPTSPGSSITSPGEMMFLGIMGLAFGIFFVVGVGWEEFKSIAANRQKMADSMKDTNTDKG